MLQNRTPEDVLKAFSSLRNDPRFIKIIDYLQEELNQSDQRLRLATELVTIGKYQGMSLTLKSFIEKAQDSYDILQTKK